MRRMRADHLKRRGDEALKAGDLRGAGEFYAQCLAVRPERAGAEAVLGNRSLALARARRFAEALRDADAAVRLKPGWAKGHWRRAAALRGLNRRREALAALREAWPLAAPEDRAEVARALADAAGRLTREELGEECLGFLARLEAAGALTPPEVEVASEEELVEAYYRRIKEVHDLERDRARGRPKQPPEYVRKVCEWSKAGMDPAAGYLERSLCFCAAQCFLQARQDGKAALALLEREEEAEEPAAGATTASFARRRAAALMRVGESYMCACREGHEDQDWRKAAKYFAKASDLQPEDRDAANLLAAAGHRLSQAEMSSVLEELYAPSVMERELAGVDAAGHSFRVAAELVVRAPRARLNARARELLREALAAALQVRITSALTERRHGAQVKPLQVFLDRVRSEGEAELGIGLAVHTGTDVLAARDAAALLRDPARVHAAVGGAEFAALVGPVLAEKVTAEVVEDVAAARSAGGGGASDDEAGGEAEEGALVVPARPKVDLELPYKMYRLVRADGSKVERVNKHAFAFSRIHYSKGELDEDMFIEPCDRACRWRQSSSEVVVIALTVPRDLPPGQLDVQLTTQRLRIANAATQEVYLEGELERGVVPQDSVWDPTGCDEGFTLYLRKMNLELLSTPHNHSKSWWERLFRHHGRIAWDDYDKDYSDLPDQVKRMHLIAEAKTDRTNRLQQAEKTKREALEERDAVRKRARQERLHVLRSGSYKPWVALNRANPPPDKLAAPVAPNQTDRFGR